MQYTSNNDDPIYISETSVILQLIMINPTAIKAEDLSTLTTVSTAIQNGKLPSTLHAVSDSRIVKEEGEMMSV